MPIQSSELQQLSTYQDRLTGPLPPTIESAARVAPTTFLTRISGTVSIETITPVTGGAHLICLVFTDPFPAAFLTTGNIATALQPVQNNATFLMFDPLSNKYFASAGGSAVGPGGGSVASFLAEGGQVVWTSNYNFTVTAATYFINGTQFNSPPTDITLTAAHATLDRIDVIAVTSSGTVVVITGVAAAQPSEPDIDPATQLKLGIVFVAANTTQPVGVVSTTLYAENAGGPTEWNWASVGAGWDVNSTINPIPPSTKSIDGTSIAAASYVEGTIPSGTISLPNFRLVIIPIRPKSTWTSGKGLQVSFRNSAGVLMGLAVTINRTGTFGFVHSSFVYQIVAIPVELFGLSPLDAVSKIRITNFGGSISLNMDNILLQVGGAVTPLNFLTQAQADARYRLISEVVEIDLGTVGAAETINLDGKMAANYLLTLDENLTLTLQNPAVGGHYMFIFKQDATGTNTVTFSPVPLWSGGAAPVITPAANAISLVTLAYSAVSGGKYLGAANLNNS